MRVNFKYALRSDMALLRAYAQGDIPAFEVLYHRHKDSLFNFIYRSVSRHAVAEEIAQEVWLAVIGQSAVFVERQATFRTWVYQISRNKVIDYRRKKSNQEQSGSDNQIDSLVGDEPAVEDNLLLQQLAAALDQLPDEQRETFILQQEGFSNREISEITGVGSETVKSRLRYAKSTTRQRLESGV